MDLKVPPVTYVFNEEYLSDFDLTSFVICDLFEAINPSLIIVDGVTSFMCKKQR